MKDMFKTLILMLLTTGLLTAEEKFQIHGHYSQAIAISSDKTVFGIPSDGTFDYRLIGMQFSFIPAENHKVIFQMKHRRLGRNPAMAFTEEIDYDWGFYQYNFTDDTWIKAGKILRPFGIYSEISDVSVLLPFYQATYPLYMEGNFTSKSYNGVAFNHAFHMQEDWTLSLELFAGEYEFTEWYIINNPVTGKRQELVGTVDGKNNFGFWSWLNTPYEGVRFGFGAIQSDFRNGIQYSEDGLVGPEKTRVWHASVDITRENWFLRSEGSKVKAFINDFGGFGSTSQFSLEVLNNLRFNMQYEWLTINDAPVFGIDPGKTTDFDYQRDVAVGFSYNNDGKFTLKLEGHWNRSYAIEEPFTFLGSDPPSTYFAIFSVGGAF